MSDSAFGGMIAAQGIALLAGIVTALTAAYMAWTRAPQVGGELWPYIRALVAIIAAVLGFKVGVILVVLVTMLVMGVVGVIVS